ncbi:hypothetical protein ASPZODRAFT_20232 [Penicilliopsis zonata CBS 506.65]|uniref:STEEP1 domain-containing protein n=1 Tax=Penicilliopsis zonata CBS 506.65 TaxID=1073090 RepID=A0A1L9S6D8_9EURO|nr:hypothetical protein ASPZODRAFT_20232 [Penicilliopsis zonata CBS 506.65]OJJ42705.1 hypothetical protein ASPZODRAFT_20232 [Penicilliopsis zonata CBS 506.65]
MEKKRINTYHCRFCNHLLLASTHRISSLPRRKEPCRDRAYILPLNDDEQDEQDEQQDQQEEQADDKKEKRTEYTILLSTAIPERKATMVRREDGFERRVLVRCGRCRVCVGYFLDPMHFKRVHREEEEERDTENARVVYLLPGSVVDTEGMGGAETKAEWLGWTD